MESLPHPALFAIGLVAVCWLNSYIQQRRANPNGLPLPPGPKGYPIIQNFFDFPLVKPWLVYEDWFQIYGDMVYFNVLGQGFLILRTLERANDLFEKRSTNYADRPRMHMLELMGWDYNIGLIPYGSWWRRHRRSFHEFFHAGIVSKYQPYQVATARAFVRDLLKAPEDFRHLIRLSFAATIMKVIYGIKVDSMDDPYVSNIEESMRGFAEAAMPGRFLVDMFPIMRYIPSWFPGAEWRRKADRWHKINQDVHTKPFEFVKQQMKEGTAVPCIATSMIEALPAENSPERTEAEIIAKDVCAVAYVGGADTTVSSVQSFFMAMCMYPEAQKNAQAELDSVCQGRLPEFGDRSSLPYINAIVKEIMRWQPVTPLAVAHTTTNADEYDGYYIPKGTLVMGNTWTILHDPEVFDKPSKFMPERYLKDGKINPDIRDPSVAAFGYGRRICPGRFFSDNTLFAIIAHVLSVYDIRPGVDENGKEVEIEADVTNGVITYPVPFSCRITPRSKAAEELIRHSEFTDYS